VSHRSDRSNADTAKVPTEDRRPSLENRTSMPAFASSGRSGSAVFHTANSSSVPLSGCLVVTQSLCSAS